MTRRAAVKLIALGLVGAGVGAGSSVFITRLGQPGLRPYRFFSDSEAALVIDLCEQIIPRDDVAGATDAGVVFYIDRQLAGVLARHQPIYRQALAAFGRTCVQLHRQAFAELPSEQKVAVMRLVEAGKAPAELWRGVGQAEFFRLLVAHTMQGFYGSPRHGGNRGYVSYKMLGIDYPQIIGRNLIARS